MPHVPARLRLTGATVLRDGALQARSVAIEDGHITKGPLPEVDLTGYHVLPGILDLHARAPDPRHGPVETRQIAEWERGLAARGVTTAWRTLDWSWAGGATALDRTSATLDALAAPRDRLIDLRAQLLCEIHTVDSHDRLCATVRRIGLDSVLFENRLDHLRQIACTDGVELARIALEAGQTLGGFRAALKQAEARRAEVPRHLCRLAETFDTLGVIYGSLGDADGETREYFTQIGARVCALPQARSAAALARAVGDPVLVEAAAPQAHGLLRAGLGSALVSGRDPAALLRCVLGMVDAGQASLPQAWSMISSVPADVMRLTDRDNIDYGRRADLVVMHADRRTIEATICGGRVVWLAGEAAERFAPARAWVGLAAE